MAALTNLKLTIWYGRQANKQSFLRATPISVLKGMLGTFLPSFREKDYRAEATN